MKMSKFLFTKILFLYANIAAARDKSSVIPLSYDVTLTPRPGDITLDGRVVMGITTTETLKEIDLSSRKLTIGSVRVKWGGMMTVEETHVTNVEKERLRIRFDSLYPGNHTVTLTFQAPVTNGPLGFFNQTCHSAANTSWIAGAALEGVNARAVFPSFDTMYQKVPTRISVMLDQDYGVVTSPAVIARSGAVGAVSGDLMSVSLERIGWSIYVNDARVRSEAVKGKRTVSCRPNTRLLMAVDAMETAMRRYTGSGLEGTAWIAIPDLTAPFISSHGIVFIREHILEQSEYTNSIALMENLVTIAEAYSGQWFGHSLTTSSWSESWFTRGLANFFKYKLAPTANDKLQIEDYIAGEVLPRVLEREAIPHSLSRKADSKQDVISMDDPDLCDRAGLIFRMVEDKVGENAFRRAIMDFVNKTKANGTAHAQHLWQSLERASLDLPENRSVEEVMKTWIQSPGYPILNVRRHRDHIHITQENVVRREEKDETGYWWVPVTVSSRSIAPRKFWLRPRGQLKVDLPHQEPWFIVNGDAKGFYRVNYEVDGWRNLSEAVKRNELDGVALAKLLDDALALSEMQLLPYSTSLALTRLLASKNTGHTPWRAVLNHFATLRNVLKPTHKSSWDQYVTSLLESLLFEVDGGMYETGAAGNGTEGVEPPRLMTPPEGETWLLNSMYIVKALCRDNPYCGNLITLLSNSTETKDPMRSITDVELCLKMVRSDVSEKDVDAWVEVYRQYMSASYEHQVIAGLACLTRPDLRLKLLNLMMDKGSGLKKQDFTTLVTEMIRSQETASQVLRWIEDHVDAFATFSSGDMALMTNLFTRISQYIYSVDLIVKTKSLVSELERRGISTSDLNRHQLHRAITRMNWNQETRERRSREVSDWLEGSHNLDTDFSTSSASIYSFVSAALIFTFLLSLVNYSDLT